MSAVEHPEHYGGDTTYECIKVCEAWGLDADAYLFNVVKYISRAGKKGDALEDLKKARFYLDRRIGLLEAAAVPGTTAPKDEPRRKPDDDPDARKMCKTCKTVKPLGEYHKNKTSRDGRNAVCKSCRSEYMRGRKAQDRKEAPLSSTRELRAVPSGERLCANGPRCVAIDDMNDSAAILDAKNPGPLCRRCQKRAGVSA